MDSTVESDCVGCVAERPAAWWSCIHIDVDKHAPERRDDALRCVRLDRLCVLGAHKSRLMALTVSGIPCRGGDGIPQRPSRLSPTDAPWHHFESRQVRTLRRLRDGRPRRVPSTRAA